MERSTETSHLETDGLVERWYRIHRGQLVRFLRLGVGSPDDVNDLAQEVFLRLLRVPRPDLIRAPRDYLYRIATHVLAEWRARERRAGLHRSIEPGEDLPAADGNGPADRREALDVTRALAELPAAQASALVLRWHYGMTYREIAAELDVTERMVKRYVVKGYAALRVRLDEVRERPDD